MITVQKELELSVENFKVGTHHITQLLATDLIYTCNTFQEWAHTSRYVLDVNVGYIAQISLVPQVTMTGMMT